MKRQIKIVLSSIFFYFGLFHLVRWWNFITGKRVTILTFHRVTGGAGSAGFTGLPTISISKPNFERLIEFARKYFTIISQSELIDLIKEGSRPRHHTLLITFDDGYKEVLANAVPILQKYNLPSVLFVPTFAIDEGDFFWWDATYELFTRPQCHQYIDDYLKEESDENHIKCLERISAENNGERDRAIFSYLEVLQNSPQKQREHFISFIRDRFASNGTRHHPDQVMNWSEIVRISSSGVEIGSHTVHHPFLSTMQPEEVRWELAESKRVLEEKLNGHVDSFCFPGGKYSQETLRLVAEAGYTCAFTTDSGLNATDDDVFSLKRINMWDAVVTRRDGTFSRAITAWTLFLRH
jgi:peptidoglycan/xylan/chitin deacetylase (PgdA/CDA1 family)